MENPGVVYNQWEMFKSMSLFSPRQSPLKLSFDELIANTNFPPGGSFQVNGMDPGEIRVIWQEPLFNGVTAADGTVIASVCFDVLIACDAPVQITGSAVDLLATDNSGASIPVDVVDGGVNLGVNCDGGSNPENLIIDIQNGTGLAGEEVCVDVLVTNFTSLTELSFTLNYDPAVLTFTGVQNFGLGQKTSRPI